MSRKLEIRSKQLQPRMCPGTYVYTVCISFKFRTQLVRHKIRWTLKSLMKPMKQWKMETDGVYKCLKCGKSYPCRMSISQHVKVCVRIKPVKVIERTICGKSFMYPSYLN